MDSIRKKIAPWEIRYGQTSFQGSDYAISKRLFADYIGTTFTLETSTGSFRISTLWTTERAFDLLVRHFSAH